MMKTLIKPTVSNYTLNKSKFLGFSFNVSNKDEVTTILSSIKNQYNDATHVCYAYVLGNSQQIQKFDDAGEPSHTAGFPILSLMLKNQLTNALLIVVRYFGGQKLGVGPLTRSYSQAASLLLKDNLTDFVTYINYELVCSYQDLDQVLYFCDKNKILISKRDFLSQSIVFQIKVCSDITLPSWFMALVQQKNSAYDKQNF